MEHKKAKWSGGASGLNEKTLSLLFDYQRFEHEPELEALLDEAENEYCAELSDDDLAQVSAAGEAKRIKRRGTDGTEEREALYTAYSEKVRGYVFGKVANRHDAEDLVSDVFLKAYEKYPTFDAGRASVSTWLYTITRNTVIDYFRTHRPGVELPEDLPDAAGIDDGLLQRESLQALGEALNRLDERLRALIVLRYGKGLSLKDTAARLGVSYAYVKILHSNALKTLRECFEAPIK